MYELIHSSGFLKDDIYDIFDCLSVTYFFEKVRFFLKNVLKM